MLLQGFADSLQLINLLVKSALLSFDLTTAQPNLSLGLTLGEEEHRIRLFVDSRIGFRLSIGGGPSLVVPYHLNQFIF